MEHYNALKDIVTGVDIVVLKDRIDECQQLHKRIFSTVASRTKAAEHLINLKETLLPIKAQIQGFMGTINAAKRASKEIIE